MAFYDYGEPIRYIIDRYFEKKRLYGANSGSTGGLSGTSLSSSADITDSLPEIPCHIIRDENGRVWRVVYGEVSLLEGGGGECDPVVWQEELLRDGGGKVTGITTTYPDGETVTTTLIRGSDGRLADYTYQ